MNGMKLVPTSLVTARLAIIAIGRVGESQHAVAVPADDELQLILDNRSVAMLAVAHLIVHQLELGRALLNALLQLLMSPAEDLLGTIALRNIFANSFVGDDPAIRIAHRNIAKFHKPRFAVGTEDTCVN